MGEDEKRENHRYLLRTMGEVWTNRRPSKVVIPILIVLFFCFYFVFSDPKLLRSVPFERIQAIVSSPWAVPAWIGIALSLGAGVALVRNAIGRRRYWRALQSPDAAALIQVTGQHGISSRVPASKVINTTRRPSSTRCTARPPMRFARCVRSTGKRSRRSSRPWASRARG
jgi:hypothetical protein